MSRRRSLCPDKSELGGLRYRHRVLLEELALRPDDEADGLIVKPIEPGLETDLIIPTDRRTYVVKLVSDPTRFISRLTFSYPADDKAKWSEFEAWQDSAKRDAEAQRVKNKQAGVLPLADGALDRLYFDYKLEGDPAYRPERVLDDGVHTLDACHATPPR